MLRTDYRVQRGAPSSTLRLFCPIFVISPSRSIGVPKIASGLGPLATYLLRNNFFQFPSFALSLLVSLGHAVLVFLPGNPLCLPQKTNAIKQKNYTLSKYTRTCFTVALTRWLLCASSFPEGSIASIDASRPLFWLNMDALFAAQYLLVPFTYFASSGSKLKATSLHHQRCSKLAVVLANNGNQPISFQQVCIPLSSDYVYQTTSNHLQPARA